LTFFGKKNHGGHEGKQMDGTVPYHRLIFFRSAFPAFLRHNNRTRITRMLRITADRAKTDLVF